MWLGKQIILIFACVRVSIFGHYLMTRNKLSNKKKLRLLI